MKYIEIKGTGLKLSNVVMGCMRICGQSHKETASLVKAAIEEGVNFFDHADIYGHKEKHECEAHFAQALDLTASARENMIIQSKCGISPGYYDHSKAHILTSVDNSLRALRTDYLDVLLLHRPDTLMEPDEVAEAFAELKNSGKVRYFGVSNYNSAQIELLQRALPDRLLFNQLQLSLPHAPMIDSGMAVNMQIGQSVDRTDSVLEYCRLKDITIQAWSPFQWGFFDGVFLGDRERYKELNEAVDVTAGKYDVSPNAVAVGWITRHPAHMQVVVGTTREQRFRECCQGSELPLTRQEWYALYRAAGHMIP